MTIRRTPVLRSLMAVAISVTGAHAQPVPEASAAAEVVASLKKGGVDFIKVEGSLSRSAYLAVAGAARVQKIPFAGHIPPAISVREASDLGQRSVEHLGGPQYQMLIACSTREDELRSEMGAIFERQVTSAIGGGDPDPEHQRAAFTRRILDAFDDRKFFSRCLPTK